MREARINWGVENNIYQLWHRGYVAVKAARWIVLTPSCRTWLPELTRLPWEDQVKITDGTSCGFPTPIRVFTTRTAKAAE